MKFKKAVENTSTLANSYQKGLRALESKDKKCIACDKPRVIAGSIYLDEALKEHYPQDPRWDYGVGIEIDSRDDRIVWLEVHPASTATVSEVIRKHTWLRKFLDESAATLQQMPTHFV